MGVNTSVLVITVVVYPGITVVTVVDGITIVSVVSGTTVVVVCSGTISDLVSFIFNCVDS